MCRLVRVVRVVAMSFLSMQIIACAFVRVLAVSVLPRLSLRHRERTVVCGPRVRHANTNYLDPQTHAQTI